jgi:hypothetical protein
MRMELLEQVQQVGLIEKEEERGFVEQLTA